MKRSCSITSLILLGVLLLPAVAVAQNKTSTMTIQVKRGSKLIVGQPISYFGNKLELLKRDGRLTTVPYNGRGSYKYLSDTFKPFNASEMQAELRKEFGRKYHVSATGHYLVAHPDGNFAKWAAPFEKEFQRFRAYFLMRGHRLDEPQFPMVAVVLKTRAEFDWFLNRYQGGSSTHSYTLGYYSPRSNRIITYDQSDDGHDGSVFDDSTLIHEIAHQAAYNTNLHLRMGGHTPRWVAEGLAMLFEAKGINQSRSTANQSDRINFDRMKELRQWYFSGNGFGNIDKMIRSDQWFRGSPMSYPLAWGLTFYLSEKKPKLYHRYLKESATPSTKDRLAMFTDAFGNDLDKLERDMIKFFAKIDP